ncbi:hypothetical protein [Leisingera caerulea]|uniref:hypothetical protein n=1 Tax=Leisingera caerulea TaxID=506591 RepID=UPI0004238177|nr:hypothetical protein [Leisingera caerulea]
MPAGTPEWTRLPGTALWSAAQERHALEGWRRYHDFNHPHVMYDRAAKLFGFPYCVSLDRSIATHDVIVDTDQPERDSEAWLQSHLEQPDRLAGKLIFSTIEHRPCEDNRLILLDLGGFLDPQVMREETEQVRQEMEARHGWDLAACREKASGYLAGLEQRLRDGVQNEHVPSGDKGYLLGIADGVGETVSELRSSIEIHLF